jgi:hypothetical protein
VLLEELRLILPGGAVRADPVEENNEFFAAFEVVKCQVDTSDGQLYHGDFLLMGYMQPA